MYYDRKVAFLAWGKLVLHDFTERSNFLKDMKARYTRIAYTIIPILQFLNIA